MNKLINSMAKVVQDEVVRSIKHPVVPPTVSLVNYTNLKSLGKAYAKKSNLVHTSHIIYQGNVYTRGNRRHMDDTKHMYMEFGCPLDNSTLVARSLLNGGKVFTSKVVFTHEVGCNRITNLDYLCDHLKLRDVL